MYLIFRTCYTAVCIKCCQMGDSFEDLGDQSGVRSQFIDHVITMWQQNRPWAAITAYDLPPTSLVRAGLKPVPYSSTPWFWGLRSFSPGRLLGSCVPYTRTRRCGS